MTEMTAKLAADIPVPVGGFEWAGPELIAIGEPRHYNPFDETPGLFLTFADCEALDLCHTLGEKVPEGRWGRNPRIGPDLYEQVRPDH